MSADSRLAVPNRHLHHVWKKHHRLDYNNNNGNGQDSGDNDNGGSIFYGGSWMPGLWDYQQGSFFVYNPLLSQHNTYVFFTKPVPALQLAQISHDVNSDG